MTDNQMSSQGAPKRATDGSFVASLIQHVAHLPIRRWVSIAMVVLFLGAVWWWVLPPSIGGRTTFFVTKGISMEPYLHTNDLAILHQKRDYKVGDVVAYHSRSLNVVLLHRIIAVDDDKLTTKGDNNDFIDNDRPTREEVIGALDHRIEGAGKNFVWLKERPVRILATILICFAIFSYLYSLFHRTIRRKEPESDDEDSEGPLDAIDEPAIDSQERSSFVLPTATPAIISVAIAGVLLIATSFVLPAGTTSKESLRYEMNGRIDYAAKGSSGSDLIYENGEAKTGETLYYSLIEDIRFHYTYEMQSDVEPDTDGTFSMNALITGPSGWQHQLVLVPQTTFEGGRYETDATLKMSELRDLVGQINRATNLKDVKFKLEILPIVNVDGKISGGAVQRTMSTPLTLNADGQTIKMQGATNQTDPTKSTALPGLDKPPPNESSLSGNVRTGAAARATSGIALIIRAIGALMVIVAAGLAGSRRGRREAYESLEGLNLRREAELEYEQLLAKSSPRETTAESRFGLDKNAPDDKESRVQ